MQRSLLYSSGFSIPGSRVLLFLLFVLLLPPSSPHLHVHIDLPSGLGVPPHTHTNGSAAVWFKTDVEHLSCLLIVIRMFSCTEWPDVSVFDTVLHPLHESILTKIAVVLLFLSCLQTYMYGISKCSCLWQCVADQYSVWPSILWLHDSWEKNQCSKVCFQCQINQVNGVPVNKRFPAFVL